MILLLDNYDSFTYNLYQYLCELGADVQVVRNDETTVEEIEQMRPEKIVVSPGPRTPEKLLNPWIREKAYIEILNKPVCVFSKSLGPWFDPEDHLACRRIGGPAPLTEPRTSN